MSSSNGSSGSGGKSDSYRVIDSGTNGEGNRWDTRDYGSGARNPNSYHYSNQDGSYYYSNPNGSTYHNSGNGFSRYTSPSGQQYESSNK